MRRWNLDGLYRHAQGLKERGNGLRRGRSKPTKREPWTCPKCGKEIEHYRATHLEICDGK